MRLECRHLSKEKDELPSYHVPGFEGAACSRLNTSNFEKHEGADRTFMVRRQIDLVQQV